MLIVFSAIKDPKKREQVLYLDLFNGYLTVIVSGMAEGIDFTFLLKICLKLLIIPNTPKLRGEYCYPSVRPMNIFSYN